MKYLISCFLLWAWVHSNCVAQGRYDANWVFGENCGLNFDVNGNVTPFSVACSVDEACGSISDRNGNLEFYVSGDPTGGYLIMKANGDTLDGSRELIIGSSVTNGVTIIPFDGGDTTLYHILHIGENNPLNCNRSRCYNLYNTLVQRTPNELKLIYKNRLVDNNFIQEHLAAVKHANGKDYFIFTRELEDNSSCSNRYFVHLLSNTGIELYTTNNVGTNTCFGNSFSGEITVSNDGSKIAIVYPRLNIVDVLGLNRCLGVLSLKMSLSVGSVTAIYGVCFSPNGDIIYVTDGGYSNNPARLLQFDLTAVDVEASLTPIWVDTNQLSSWFSQMELAENDKLYFSKIIDHDITSTYNVTIGVVNEPNNLGVACNFDSLGVLLTINSYARNGLPNMPNYNLGATSIYQADAGVDTFLCIYDTTAKGIEVGMDSVMGVTYEWLNLDSTNYHKFRSRAFVEVDSTTWFYLQLTDTTIQGSCQTRIDSVLVERRFCTGVEEIDLAQVKVYPNPANSSLTIEMPQGTANMQFELYDIVGEQVRSIELSTTKRIDISELASGMYLYSIINDQGAVHTGKLLIER